MISKKCSNNRFPQEDSKQKTETKKKKGEREKKKTKDTIADLSPDLSIITLNENGLKTLTKIWRLAEGILKHD